MRIALLTTLLACGLAAQSAQAASNPLFGKWKLVKPDCDVMTQMEFSAGAYGGFETPAGYYPGWHRLAVTYNVSATEVWVMVNGAFSNRSRVFVLDANHIKNDDGKGCIYERVA